MPYSKPRSSFFAGLGVLTLVVASCGGSNGSSSDAGGDITHKPVEVIFSDGGGDDGSAAAAGWIGDGTTGNPCQTDADCVADGGPGITLCSNNPVFTLPVTNVKVNLLPTPICLVPPAAGGNCDPAPPGGPAGALYQCDGPNSLCVAFPDPLNPVPGQGICQLSCFAPFDGTQAKGCPGQDSCVILIAATDPKGNNVGLGFCQGSCEKDADCAGLNAAAGADAGPPWVCQTDIGFCTQHPRTRTKAIGAACVSSGRNDDNTSGACYCPIGNTLSQGFCTQACLVGGAPCPDGWQCDAQEPAMLSDGTLVTKQNLYAVGLCMPACVLDGGTANPPPDAGSPAPDSGNPPADASSDASSDAVGDTGTSADASGSPIEASTPADTGTTVSTMQCPPNSTCKSVFAAGPECMP